MNVLKIVGDSLLFQCLGCGFVHYVRFHNDGLLGPIWKWNEDLINPTITPSILIRYPSGNPPVTQVCHSFINDGHIEFLKDSTHSLSGKTIRLEEIIS